MSELKEYLCVEALVPEIKEIPGYLMHMAKYRAPQAEMELVYLKSEADNVIAELKNKLQNVSELLNETREWLVESQKLHKRCADNAIKVIAELQAQKAQAEDDCAYWKNLAQKKKKQWRRLTTTKKTYKLR